MRKAPLLARLFTAWLLAMALSSDLSLAMGGTPQEWVELDAGPFTLRTPPEMKLVRHQGIDSAVGRIEGGGVRLEYDFGAYSDPLAPQGHESEYRSREVTIDGRPAKLVSFRDARRYGRTPYVSGVHFPKIAASPLGAIKLTVVGSAASAEALAVVEKIFQTIRIKPLR